MDQLASRQGKAPWPGFPEVHVARLADGFGCPADSVATVDAIVEVMDRVIPTLRTRSESPLVNVEIMTDGGEGR
jgi:benzoylformate decarboxylase